jgi:hypothetical protein
MAATNQTATWSPHDLHSIGASEELQLASRRPDGSLRPFVTIWVVRAGNDLYIRIVGSVTGPGAHRVTVRLVPQAEER